MQDILKRIRQLFDTSEFNQTNLQPKIGIPSSSMSEWSKGKGSPSIESLKKIAEYFDTSIDWIVYGDECERFVRFPFKSDEWMESHYKTAVSRKKFFSSHTGIENQLSSDEQQLLDRYALLSADQQAKVDGYIDAMLGLQSQPKKKQENATRKIIL